MESESLEDEEGTECEEDVGVFVDDDDDFLFLLMPLCFMNWSNNVCRKCCQSFFLMCQFLMF